MGGSAKVFSHQSFVLYSIYLYHKTLAVENFGGSTHPDILAEKTFVDGDNKSFLLVRTELIIT